jgi:hypothetical protein
MQLFEVAILDRKSGEAEGSAVRHSGAPLLEDAVRTGTPKKLTSEQLDNTLRELAQFSAKIPLLPDEATLSFLSSREPVAF